MKKILLIEDDLDIRGYLTQLLTMEDYEVITAAHGGQALELLGRTEILPDLILLDLRMPIMDGHEFRQAQLTDSRLAHIPVVMMTADGHVDQRLTPVTDVIRKPADIDHLLETLKRHLD